MTQQTKLNDNFFQISKTFFSASHIEHTNIETGEIIRENLTADFKLIYAYMYDKAVFFSKRKQPYFETQELIALQCNCAEKTVRRAINIFKAAGVIMVSKQKGKSYLKNQYFIKDVSLCDGWILVKSDKLIQHKIEQEEQKQLHQKSKSEATEEWSNKYEGFIQKQPFPANRSDSKRSSTPNDASVLPDIPDAYKQPYKEPVRYTNNNEIINDDYLYNNNDDDPFHVGFYAAMNSKQESIPTHYYNDNEQPPFENDCRYDPNCPF